LDEPDGPPVTLLFFSSNVFGHTNSDQITAFFLYYHRTHMQSILQYNYIINNKLLEFDM